MNQPTQAELTALRDECYEIACEHGFHDEEHSERHYLCLVITELGEAVEADRNGRRADMESFNERMNNLDGSDECFKEMYKRYIKGSIEEEFADVVIRVLDMAQEVHGDRMRWLGYYPWGQVYHEDKSFIENAWYFIREILNWGTMNISDSVSFMFDWAQDLGIDLWQHIEWKMKYNELRPYKHGGKKY
jgi:NTP pyrophosphatase (non-canonical NTP hydrolase)